jgi:ABC-type transport system substrate-binding protein
MKPSFTSAFILIILSTVTFYSCERIVKLGGERAPKGDVNVGGTLKVAISAGVNSYLPSMITDATSSEIGTQIHCGLLRLNPQSLEIIPGIAERWSVDNKGTSFVFNLRTGAKFHDDEVFAGTGREITAYDFKYTFELLCGQENNSAFETTFRNRVTGANAFHAGEADQIVGVQVIDDYTIRIELDKPDESFLFVLAQPSTAVVSGRAYAKYGTDSKVGAGPFAFHSNDGALVLVRNAESFRSDAFGNMLPYVDTLIFSTVSSKQEQLEAFFRGDLDLVSGLYLDPVRQIFEQHISGFSGKTPKYIMKRESESAGYESYSIHDSELKGFGSNFMGYRDFSRVQIER